MFLMTADKVNTATGKAWDTDMFISVRHGNGTDKSRNKKCLSAFKVYQNIKAKNIFL